MGNSNPNGTTVFVLGLLSIITCQLLGPVAWWMGNNYVAECAAAGIEPDGLGVAGRVMGIIGTVLFVFWLLFIFLYIGFIFCMVGGAIVSGA